MSAAYHVTPTVGAVGPPAKDTAHGPTHMGGNLILQGRRSRNLRPAYSPPGHFRGRRFPLSSRQKPARKTGAVWRMFTGGISRPARHCVPLALPFSRFCAARPHGTRVRRPRRTGRNRGSGRFSCCARSPFYRTFRENPYLSPAVRVQTERAQKVVSTGPYRYVRHPMYAAFVLFTFGTALLLGSWYGLLGGLLLIGMVARRAVLEERVLQEELEGYSAYMLRVRYRFVPHLW
jgi:hypothetical protein